MSSIFGNLPPPFPNAAQSLSRLSGDAQLRERVERASEHKPIRTDFPPEFREESGTETHTGSQGGDSPSGSSGSRLDVSA